MTLVHLPLVSLQVVKSHWIYPDWWFGLASWSRNQNRTWSFPTILWHWGRTTALLGWISWVGLSVDPLKNVGFATIKSPSWIHLVGICLIHFCPTSEFHCKNPRLSACRKAKQWTAAIALADATMKVPPAFVWGDMRMVKRWLNRCSGHPEMDNEYDKMMVAFFLRLGGL